MTSLLRELVPVPMESSASSTRVSRPRTARARATARPTTPAPMTTQSTFSAIVQPGHYLQDTRLAIRLLSWAELSVQRRENRGLTVVTSDEVWSAEHRSVVIACFLGWMLDA